MDFTLMVFRNRLCLHKDHANAMKQERKRRHQLMRKVLT